MRDAGQPTDAIWTVPNVLTFVRLGLIPVFVWVAVIGDRVDIGLVLAATGLVTDLADGKIARRFGQISRLGIALDPLADRLSLAAGAAALIVHDLAPIWVFAVVVGRDAALLVAAAFLKGKGRGIPPVSRVGKLASFGISLTFGLFLGSGWSDPADPIGAIAAAGWVTFALSAPLYYVAAAGYAKAAFGAPQGHR